MQFALLGTDSNALALAAAAKLFGHEIVWLGEVRPDDAEPTRAITLTRPAPDNDWEMLLDQATADAVIIGRGTAGDELRAEQLKRLATDAVPMLIVHPACDSVLTYYEVDMIRRETGALVQHFNPQMGHSSIDDVRGWIRDGHPAVGTIHQISCDRLIAAPNRANVLKGLARDAELLAAIAGDMRKVSALGPGHADASFASTQVQMTTTGPASVRWSIAPPSGRDEVDRITLVGERGVVELNIGINNWRAEAIVEGRREPIDFAQFDAPSHAIKQLAAAIAESDATRRAAASTWDKATRAMEVVDAVELSLAKGRTMEVHQQQLTERLAFRGTMAAFGCGLLMLTLFAFVVAGVFGNFLGMPNIGPLPMIVLAVLAAFLLLQAIPILVSKKAAKPHSDGPAA